MTEQHLEIHLCIESMRKNYKHIFLNNVHISVDIYTLVRMENKTLLYKSKSDESKLFVLITRVFYKNYSENAYLILKVPLCIIPIYKISV